MAYFEGQGGNWPHQHTRQQSWNQQGQNPPSTVGTPGSQQHMQEDAYAFDSQFEEVARASDNLAKSGRVFGMPGMSAMTGAGLPMHGRRESLPMMGAPMRPFPEFNHHNQRMHGSQRHHSVDYDGMRANSSHSQSSLQGYLSHQRFGSRPSESEQMLQAKRRAAAQRERELRNYHQEQQYNRSSSGPKSDRSMSPSAISDEDRRELIARQHRALYGDGSNLYMAGNDKAGPRPISQDARVLAAAQSAGHGSSPLAYDTYGQATSGSSGEAGSAIAGQNSRSRANSTASKSPNPNQFAMFESAQQQAQRTSTSSPGGSPTRAGANPATAVGAIGTRPSAQNSVAPAKRSTPPMPSPLSYGFNNEKGPAGAASSTERSGSAASNPTTAQGEKQQTHIGWGGGNNGPWGNNKNLGVQASVWG